MSAALRQPAPEAAAAARSFIDASAQSIGITIGELAERLDYRSLRRVRSGEFPLPDTKRRHIEDLVRLAELERRITQSAQPEIVPADVAGLADGELAAELVGMVQAFDAVPVQFAGMARVNVATRFTEWLRRKTPKGAK